MGSASGQREGERERARAQRADRILDEARALFLEKGIEAVEVQSIAAAAQIGRATLYRYFPSKRALAFAIVDRDASRKFVLRNREERRVFRGTGREKFAQFLEQLVRVYRTEPEFFRLSAMVTSHYETSVPVAEQVQAIHRRYPGLFLQDTPEQFLVEGQRDGSVRLDLDPKLYYATVLTALPALAEEVLSEPALSSLVHGIGDPFQMVEIIADVLLKAVVPDPLG